MHVVVLAEALVAKYNVEIFVGINEQARHAVQGDPELRFLLRQFPLCRVFPGNVAPVNVDVDLARDRCDREGEDAIAAFELALPDLGGACGFGTIPGQIARERRLPTSLEQTLHANRGIVGVEHGAVGQDPEHRVRVLGRKSGEIGDLLIGEISIASLRRYRRAASISGFDRGGALFERIDLVDQLRFRLAKAPHPDSGWIGYMPLLANRHCLGGIWRKRTVPQLGVPANSCRVMIYRTERSPFG